VFDEVEWNEILMENGETKEILVVKKMAPNFINSYGSAQTILLISRYPSNVGQQWIEENEQEAVEWDFNEQNGRICVGNPS
jgi:hypothetical protein